MSGHSENRDIFWLGRRLCVRRIRVRQRRWKRHIAVAGRAGWAAPSGSMWPSSPSRLSPSAANYALLCPTAPPTHFHLCVGIFVIVKTLQQLYNTETRRERIKSHSTLQDTLKYVSFNNYNNRFHLKSTFHCLIVVCSSSSHPSVLWMIG